MGPTAPIALLPDALTATPALGGDDQAALQVQPMSSIASQSPLTSLQTEGVASDEALHESSKTTKVLGSLWQGFELALNTAESFADACPQAKGAITGLLKVIEIAEVCPIGNMSTS